MIAPLLLALSPLGARAQAPAAAAAAPPNVVSSVLSNGMRVILVPKHEAPTIAFHVMFKVGSVDEEAGHTGLAHMFEHMIFKGTKKLYSRDWKKEKPVLDEIEAAAQELLAEQEKTRPEPAKLKTLKAALDAKEAEADQYVIREEYEKLYETNGAEGLNAYTAEDRTAYLVSLPANRLEFWMAMEAERLRDPILREFYKERDVVMEERRMRTDSDPMGKLWEAMISAAYTAHPYGHDVIGWMSDLRSMSRTDAERFFEAHYGPNNAVAVLVGDLDPDRTLALFKKYFEPIPARPLARRHITEEPEQLGPRRVAVEFEAEPLVIAAWHKPNLPAREDTALQMLSDILSDGRTSRFYKDLVEGKKLASSASSDAVGVGERQPNLFVVWGEPRHPHTAAELEAGLLAEIERIKREPPSDWEMEKVRNRLTASLIKQLESAQGMATKLAYYQTEADDWSYPWKLQKLYGEITPAEIQEAARKYLAPRNSTTAVLVKPPPAAVAAATAAPPASKGLEFQFTLGSAALGAKAQEAVKALAARAAAASSVKVKVVVRSLASEDAQVTQRRTARAADLLKSGGLPAERIELRAETGDKPGILFETAP